MKMSFSQKRHGTLGRSNAVRTFFFLMLLFSSCGGGTSGTGGMTSGPEGLTPESNRITLSGTILNTGNQALNNVHVSVNGQPEATVTDAHGKFEITTDRGDSNIDLVIQSDNLSTNFVLENFDPQANAAELTVIVNPGTNEVVNTNVHFDVRENPDTSSGSPPLNMQQEPPTPTGVFCTQDAKQCPDGSYVSRVGPSCEFAPCPDSPPVACTQDAKQCGDGTSVGRVPPSCDFAPCPGTTPSPECTSDADCLSSQVCEGQEGTGTVSSGNSGDDPQSTFTITSGECKTKEGGSCNQDSDCARGALCHSAICIQPIGRECSGPRDSSCLSDFECVQGCGPPVFQEGAPPPPYFCQLKGYMRACPICLAENTRIDTLSGEIAVQELRKGMTVWSVNSSGARAPAKVLTVSRTPVPSDHQVVHLVLDDGREVFVSPGHPTADGRTIGDLAPGDMIDGGRVVTAKRIPYRKGFTYDVLPAGKMGFYWANGILIGSTLSQRR